MRISAIAAVARNGVIGRNNKIPWHLPRDLAYFKRITLGHCVVMGRNSFQSIGRPLPKRTNIVITRDLSFNADGILVVHSLEAALDLALEKGETEVFIIGGSDIYRQSMHRWDRLYLTEVDAEIEGDAFFPEVNFSEWCEIWREEHLPDAQHPYAYTFRILERIPR